jgi:hypothetical protein
MDYALLFLDKFLDKLDSDNPHPKCPTSGIPGPTFRNADPLLS